MKTNLKIFGKIKSLTINYTPQLQIPLSFKCIYDSPYFQKYIVWALWIKSKGENYEKNKIS